MTILSSIAWTKVLISDDRVFCKYIPVDGKKHVEWTETIKMKGKDGCYLKPLFSIHTLWGFKQNNSFKNQTLCENWFRYGLRRARTSTFTLSSNNFVHQLCHKYERSFYFDWASSWIDNRGGECIDSGWSKSARIAATKSSWAIHSAVPLDFKVSSDSVFVHSGNKGWSALFYWPRFEIRTLLAPRLWAWSIGIGSLLSEQ